MRAGKGEADKPPLIIAHTSVVGDIQTEFLAEAQEPDRVVAYRKTCLICKIHEAFYRKTWADDYSVFAQNSAFAGLHYRLHGELKAFPDEFGTEAVF